jgi:hypothetical protein
VAIMGRELICTETNPKREKGSFTAVSFVRVSISFSFVPLLCSEGFGVRGSIQWFLRVDCISAKQDHAAARYCYFFFFFV